MSTRPFFWRVAAPLAILGLLWFAWYSHCHTFGFYEDDYAVVSPPLLNPSLSGRALQLWVTSGFQGRPIGYFGILVLCRVAGLLGLGVWGAYWIAFLLVGTNGILFHDLVRRFTKSDWLAFVAGAGFVLLPLDGTRALLCNVFGIQPAVLFFLLAWRAFFEGRLRTSHFLALLSLLSYEMLYPAFALVPLFHKPVRQWLKHLAVCAAIFLTVFGVRTAAGEERALLHTPKELLWTVLSNWVRGPAAALEIFGGHLRWGLGELTWVGLVVVVVVGSALEWGRRRSVVPPLRQRLRWLAVSLVLLAVGYSLVLTQSPRESAGRATRVHVVAVPALALGLSVLSVTTGPVGPLAVAMVGVLSFNKGQRVQGDFASAWMEQKQFWSDLLRLCPDLTAESVVLVDRSGMPQVPGIRSFDWTLPIILWQLVGLPLRGQHQGRVYLTQPGWQQHIRNGRVDLNGSTVETSPYFYRAGLDMNQIIVLKWESGRITRNVSALPQKYTHPPHRFLYPALASWK